MPFLRALRACRVSQGVAKKVCFQKEFSEGCVLQRCTCGCQGLATAMVPRCHGGRSGEGARDLPLVPGSTQPGSKRPIEQHFRLAGVWGRLATTRCACPRPRRVRHARAPPVPRYAQGRRLRSASTEAWRA
jgi:hypothetical protein